MHWKDAESCGKALSELAVKALIEEAELTPKPGLVDRKDSGAHNDLNFEKMIVSANSLKSTFRDIGIAAFLKKPSQELRESIAEIGRHGEKKMFEATGGTNTHKGAIWALGLLVASIAGQSQRTSLERIANFAGEIACFIDRKATQTSTNGYNVQKRFGVQGARGEAQQGFPHVMEVALPVLREARERGLTETLARLETLIHLIARVDDTCILHRGGMDALTSAQKSAETIIRLGGVSTLEGWRGLDQLEKTLLSYNASPGGSADLLAVVLFLDSVDAKNSSALIPESLITV
ncbi:2-(5''-triphosphoribosyl)-3'-dephosphocoenzyme-A synthase [Thalassobacillus devorans]|uniref:triphosphoribosyl-dephospho-CoA synthase n=1 Tax=Thalassobacillus devorans TaxID=279813 RepID=A0ABQ1NUD5_9BACI|nr:triphosphoribosyl-dephospho-CoA synthase [Thalassobacillus devorans]NIK28787.1 triphosphoribosyl-dephospho-CoA synthase [Thalassobacillus devorans]GGC83541.1 2-(5''-triphosphoribosyl)-3'-dephosphocoenzyme-A synthase [Thalassobacillus devorans]